MRLARSNIVLVGMAIVAIAAYAFFAYSQALLNLRDAVTIIVAELIVAAILFAVSRMFRREPDTDELARKFAEEKQKLEDEAKTRDEKQRSRKEHYEDLYMVFESWSKLDDIRTGMTPQGTWDPTTATYLSAWSRLWGHAELSQWAFEHVQSGYHDLLLDINSLKTVEENSNGNVLFAYAVTTELSNMLKASFPKLSAYSKTPLANFYFFDRVLHAVYDPDCLGSRKTTTTRTEGQTFGETMEKLQATADQSSLYLRGEEIARSDPETLENLVSEIHKLRNSHLDMFQKLDFNSTRQSRLLANIRQGAREILHEIHYLQNLKGTCSLCSQF
jgi:hypothetical protein